jgi:hypothetical protein
MLYAVTVGQHSNEDLAFGSWGRLLSRSMNNGSVEFDGMTGKVLLDENGDLKESIQALNYLLRGDVLIGEQCGVYDASSGLYRVTSTHMVRWPSDVSALPISVIDKTVAGFDTKWVLVGAGTTAVAAIGALVIVVRKRRARLQGILMMLLTEVGQLLFSASSSLANIVTDGIVFRQLLDGDVAVSSEIYTQAYATILCFGIVVTVISLGSRIHNAQLVQAQLKQLAPEGSVASEAQRQSREHEWELEQTHRTKVTLSLSLMTVAAQGALAPQSCTSNCEADRSPCAADLPMSALNCCLIFVERRTDQTVPLRRQPMALFRSPLLLQARYCAVSGHRFTLGLGAAARLQAERLQAPRPSKPTPGRADPGSEIAAAQA